MNNILMKDNVVNVSESKEYYIELNDNLKINVFDNVESDIILINNSCDKLIFVDVVLGVSSSLKISKINANLNANEIINIILNEDAKLDYLFSSVCSKEQYYVMNIIHNGCNSKSNVTNHLITINNGISSFDINTSVKKGFIGCTLNQDSKIITLGNKKSLIKPNLLIDEYDVDAKHSAYIGTFNEDEIFYLQSRGISQNDSMNLLKKAFLMNGFSDNEIIKECIDKLLKEI